MKNLDFTAEKYELIENTCSIPRSSNSYEFFHSEFKNLPKDLEGNILLTYELKKEDKSILKDILISIKEHLSTTDKSVGIPFGSEEYSFFVTEYNDHLSKDANHNIIVPEEIHQKIKIKK